jgi:serine protease AprX
MSHSNERAAIERGLRSSALWGTGSRGGDSRSSVLWGKGGRGIVTTCVAVCALAAPLAATADPGRGTGGVAAAVSAPATVAAPASTGHVAKDLLDMAKRSPNEKVRVIISSTGGVDAADKAVKGLGSGGASKRLALVGAVAVELPAGKVAKLQDIPGLSVVPDSIVRLSGVIKSDQLWPYESSNDKLWAGDQATYSATFPAIAVVDSGVQARDDFKTRLVASVNLCTLPNNTVGGDGRGHGTFVAGIAAGGKDGRAGAAPFAPIVSVDVMDDSGQALTSDVIAGAQWILDNKAKYNIKIANFSLHSLRPSSFTTDPLDRAVEKLWFGGVTVVAAAGNYGTAGGASGVKYAPGNDPFVITVGAVDLGGTTRNWDDAVASWSAYGYTYDGFYKPEVAAAGRYMIGPVPSGSTIAKERPDKMVGSDRIQLSGTSFAAPVVAGTAAQILARHPNWTPDEVKGALMVTARPVSQDPAAAGIGQITAVRAAQITYAPNPNLGIEKYLTTNPVDGSVSFDTLAWTDMVKAKSDLSWSDLAWSDLAWSDSNLAALAWTDLAWSDMAWTDMAASDLSWSDMAWTDSSVEDAAEGDALDEAAGYVATDAELEAAATDPALQPLVDEVPATVTDTTTTVASAPASLVP